MTSPFNTETVTGAMRSEYDPVGKAKKIDRQAEARAEDLLKQWRTKDDHILALEILAKTQETKIIELRGMLKFLEGANKEQAGFIRQRDATIETLENINKSQAKYLDKRGDEIVKLQATIESQVDGYRRIKAICNEDL